MEGSCQWSVAVASGSQHVYPAKNVGNAADDAQPGQVPCDD